MSCPFHFFSKPRIDSSDKQINQDPEAVIVHKRRDLLKGMLGFAGGSLAFPALTQAQALKSPSDASTKDEVDFMSEEMSQPFYGIHQSGVVTPQQANIALVAFDVLAVDKPALISLFKTLTTRSQFLMQGGKIAPRDDKFPPNDSGMLGPEIQPDNLTITVSVGDSLFDERYGLTSLKPKQLQRMVEFPNDALQSDLSHGDLLIQICANSANTVLYALRDIIKHTPAWLSVRWRRDGFISPYAAASMGKRTPINLLGFKDGTVNPTAEQVETEKVVWIDEHHDEPLWAIGGSYQAVRLIRFFVERWDRTPLQEQESIFGRVRSTGAPLGKLHEHDDVDYASDPEGKRISFDSHIRRANPHNSSDPQFLMLRRGYNYSYDTALSGQLDIGLLFVSYQFDLENGFIATQKRLDGEPLEEYIKPFGGGYFFTLPGVQDDSDYFAKGLLES